MPGRASIKATSRTGADLYTGSVQLLQQAANDGCGVVTQGETCVYEVDPQHAHSLLLQLSCLVQHPYVHHHRVGLLPVQQQNRSIPTFEGAFRVQKICHQKPIRLLGHECSGRRERLLPVVTALIRTRMEMFEALSCGWAETYLGALWYLSPSQPWHSLSRLKACNRMNCESHASTGVSKMLQYMLVVYLLNQR